jgi:3-hydroxyacyl-CoA dehydrogenase
MTKIDHIKKITVVGAGVMGSGIALAALLAGFEKVTINDIDNSILEKSQKLIKKNLVDFEPITNRKKGFAENPAFVNVDLNTIFEDTESLGILEDGVNKEIMMSRLYCEPDLSEAVKDADFVIEAVTEKLDIKQEIFKKLGKFTPSNTILATNTSTMSITKVGAFSGRSQDVVGLHFHSYFPLTARLIEITPGTDTSKKAMDIGYAVAEKLPCAFKDKFVVRLLKESPGLIGNRLSMVSTIYMNWILDQVYESGITTDQLGMIGFMDTVMDDIGIDVVYLCSKYFEEYVSPDFSPGKRLTQMYNEGRFGKKVGKGFFDYDENGSPIINSVEIDDETQQYLSSLMGSIDFEIFGAISLNEACRLLEEGVMTSCAIIDKTIKSGNFGEGPFTTAKENYKKWAKYLDALAEKIGKPYLKPCEMMKSGKFLEFP